MHIKKLEICGFKSFVDRTVIHFDHDVVGIVGPNGCGKSNIVDAVRWCMGEQSAKHLRGKAMEDVIFNGSESRGPHGFAEVTLTFDNTDREYAATLPAEYAGYSEIAVTRRLFRDGTSEYLINNTQVRLRDITELFLGTGVGTKAYSIVEQGRIGQIVSSRPEDRRLYIEEAAGITKYKQRRRQAERKMDLTRQNLLRIQDIVGEIERTRSSLKRQAAKAERFVRYREELEELMLHESAHRLLELIVTERVESESLGSTTARAAELRARLEQEEASLESARHEASRIEQRADEASQAAFRADNDVSALTAELTRNRDQLDHYESRLQGASSEQGDIRLRLEQLGAERHDLEGRLRSLDEDAGARQADADAEQSELDGLRAEESKAAEEVASLRQRIGDVTTEIASVEARQSGLHTRLEEARARRDRLLGERDALAEEVLDLLAQKDALDRSVAERAEGKRLSAEELDALERELTELRPRALEAERALDAAKNELGLKRNRLRALDDLHRRHEGVNAGVRALLSAEDPAVLGLVADRLEVAEEHTAALAGLLGERLQCVLVSDAEDGLRLLGDLCQHGRGRASIACARPAYVAGAARGLLRDDRALGYFAQFVRYSPKDEALARALLGDAILCRTARDALGLVADRPGATAVALDGTVVRADGIISGGGSDDVASAMVEHKREMRELAEELEVLEARVTGLAEEHRRIKNRMTEVGTSLDRARQGAHEHELMHVTAEKDLSQSIADIERARSRQAAVVAEMTELEQLLTSITAEQDESRRHYDSLCADLDHQQQALAKADASAQTWKDRVSAHASLVTERKVRLAQVREQIEATRSTLDRLTQDSEELGERLQRLDQEAHDAAMSYGETAARIVLAREGRADAEARARAAHAEQAEVRRLLEEIRGALAEREQSLKTLRHDLEQSDEAVRGHELGLQKLELEREHLLANVRDRFRGLDLHRVVGKYHALPAPDEEHRRRIDELSKLIERMGPVNLDAQTEFEDAEKRYVELSEQQQDIEKALEDLERAIKHMNRESKRRFRETFETVNELFKKTFTRLFRGGRAELVLTNPEDMLDTGVDIVAQPPGKRLGNIELMSGGEKALTATSLIFAIFQHRPSPFCVLDEVDAPLDEANVSRYTDAIRAMTDRSQFILITHVKATMQSVDVLYGVTMGEPGVSRLVSVKVNQDAQSRSERRPSELESARDDDSSSDGATQVA